MPAFLKFFFQPAFILPLTLWVLFWKGLALWRAASKRQIIWFVLLLIFNTLGIFEIIYFFWLSRFGMAENEKVLAFLNKKVRKLGKKRGRNS